MGRSCTNGRRASISHRGSRLVLRRPTLGMSVRMTRTGICALRLLRRAAAHRRQSTLSTNLAVVIRSADGVLRFTCASGRRCVAVSVPSLRFARRWQRWRTVYVLPAAKYLGKSSTSAHGLSVGSPRGTSGGTNQDQNGRRTWRFGFGWRDDLSECSSVAYRHASQPCDRLQNCASST